MKQTAPPIPCKYCNSSDTFRNGRFYRKEGILQKVHCNTCGREFSVPLNENLPNVSNVPPCGPGISETALRAKHDVAFKIKQAAESLRGDRFYPEFDFMKDVVKISGSAGYRNYINSGEFDKFRGKAGGVTYWSTPDNIARLKNEGVLK